MQPLKIAHVAPMATSIPPPKSGSVQTMTSLLTEGLVAQGHHVTLFAPGDSVTRATLHATFPRGYWQDETMWPWEMYELLNLNRFVSIPWDTISTTFSPASSRACSREMAMNGASG